MKPDKDCLDINNLDVRKIFYEFDWKKDWTRKTKPPWLNKNYFKNRTDNIWITGDNELLPIPLAETIHLVNIGSIMERDTRNLIESYVTCKYGYKGIHKINNIFNIFKTCDLYIKYTRDLFPKYKIIRDEMIKRKVLKENEIISYKKTKIREGLGK